MTENDYTAPSREELKGIIARGASNELDPGDDLWREVTYDQKKINATFDSCEAVNGEPLDQYSGENIDEIPEDAQELFSTAISYTSIYTTGTEAPVDLEADNSDFSELMEMSASISGMKPAGAVKLTRDDHEELFG